MVPLPATLTAREATEALHQLMQALEREAAPTAVIDASALQQLDSAAIALLLECRRRCEALGKSFELHGAPSKLSGLARLYGVDGLLFAAPVAAPPPAVAALHAAHPAHR